MDLFWLHDAQTSLDIPRQKCPWRHRGALVRVFTEKIMLVAEGARLSSREPNEVGGRWWWGAGCTVEHIEWHQPQAVEMTKIVDLAPPKTPRAYRYIPSTRNGRQWSAYPTVIDKVHPPIQRELNSNRHPPGTSHNTNLVESSCLLQAQHAHLRRRRTRRVRRKFRR